MGSSAGLDTTDECVAQGGKRHSMVKPSCHKYAGTDPAFWIVKSILTFDQWRRRWGYLRAKTEKSTRTVALAKVQQKAKSASRVNDKIVSFQVTGITGMNSRRTEAL